MAQKNINAVMEYLQNDNVVDLLDDFRRMLEMLEPLSRLEGTSLSPKVAGLVFTDNIRVDREDLRVYLNQEGFLNWEVFKPERILGKSVSKEIQ